MKNWTVAANSYQVEIPEIYQIELTSACNLACPACIRDDSRVRRPIGYVNPELISLMFDRGDFDGSYFVELQMYGESLLHPHFNEIVRLLKGYDIKIGMSTNGTLLDTKVDIDQLDYLTISIDSPDKLKYERLRPGSSFDKLILAIDRIQAMAKPKIDLQVIRFKKFGSELPELLKLADKMNWQNVTCREVPDGFRAYTSPMDWPEHMTNELCLNPWLSVSVQWDGDCVSCCFEAGKHNVYGNLYQQTLKEIWHTSEVRKKLMENMRLNYNKENPPCKFCYMRSPTLFHTRMLMEEIKKEDR